MPFIIKWLGNDTWGRLMCTVSMFAIVGPFIAAIIMPSIKRSEQERLVETRGTVSYVPIVVMLTVSAILAAIYIAIILQAIYPSATSVIAAVLLMLAILAVMAIIPNPFRHRLSNIEKRFINNINERENHRTGREHNLVSDLHLAHMTIGHACPFAGERLRDLDLRSRYGVNIASIQRGGKLRAVPTGDMRIFPSDVLGVIGTEEQIQRLLPLVEAQKEHVETPANEMKFVHFAISGNSPIVGQRLENTKLREDYGALLVAVQRGEDNYISPTPDLLFKTGDILWIVGDPQLLSKLK